MTEEIAKLIQKSEHALKVAQDLLNSGYPSNEADVCCGFGGEFSIRRTYRQSHSKACMARNILL